MYVSSGPITHIEPGSITCNTVVQPGYSGGPLFWHRDVPFQAIGIIATMNEAEVMTACRMTPTVYADLNRWFDSVPAARKP